MNINELSIDEKLKLLSGKTTWQTNDLDGKLNSVFVSDGPHGVRRADGNGKESTAMPNLVTVSNSWNTDMAYLQGKTIADDCIKQNVDVILAPGVNIKRTPECGRNFEYFSEDPMLAGLMAKAFISGVQDKGIGTSLKHFCANNRESDRLSQTSELDDRTLYEIYTKNFALAIEAKPWTVMCAYNPVNGVYASENKKLLKDTLRGKFGFDGVVVSDWGAVHNPYKAVRAGCDLEMPSNNMSYPNLKEAYEKGLLKIEDIDFCVKNILNLIDKNEKAKKTRKVEFTREETHKNVIKIDEEGIVLLKNEENLLPLKAKKIGVYGKFAEMPELGGGGSARVENFNYNVKPLWDTLKDVMPQSEIHNCNGEYMGNILGYKRAQRSKPAFLEAYNMDAVIVAIGDSNDVQREGVDRNDIKINKVHTEFVKRISQFNKNVIVVVHSGSAVELEEISLYAKAILFVGYGGEGVNEALANIISGKVVPSGKLTETFPLSLEDTVVGDECGNGLVDRYSEGVYVGYRYYDTFDIDVMYPFGFGLSYSSFEYSNLVINKESETDYTVSYDIKNTGKYDAKEVSQLYVKDVFAMVTRPEKELKAFSKDLIKAGETKNIKVKLDFSSFAYYSSVIDNWMIENGTFEIYVGSSVNDIKLLGKIEINIDDEFQPSQK